MIQINNFLLLTLNLLLKLKIMELELKKKILINYFQNLPNLMSSLNSIDKVQDQD